MKKFLFLFITILSPFLMMAQDDDAPRDTTWKTIYRATAPKVNDLVHTKLEVKFDYAKSYLYGKEWLTAHPHFYPTDTLTLDAKGMDIKEVALMKGTSKSPLKYSYDGLFLKINLDKKYKSSENYTVFIDYTSKPNEFKAKGSAAITNAKGLYFINPTGEEKDKPTQIWTQGETEATSVWVPTIDKPNQKTTVEIYMTVPAKYVSLSNGKLIGQKKNTDGTRTDYWKMDQPHSPYLFFMGVGDFEVIKDSYKGKEVSYYVEKEYAPVARKIFGETPGMIAFFSKITGVDYPWSKYSQIVGTDYVSGAMENTTATLHQEGAYQNARQLTDGNKWEDVISHELFHQWFGDYVTAESWTNITLNESFATYGETMWQEYRYGKDAGDEHVSQNRQSYLGNPADAQKDLVRFHYSDKEDVFDNVSYPKGAAIIHMLRNYVGDSAFFKALNIYLNTYKYKNAEVHQLRQIFEDVTGQDLNWFFNEWYFGSGHPKLKIDYNFSRNNAQVIIEQTQTTGKIFRMPINIDVYNGANRETHNVWIQNKIDTFNFTYSSKPTSINVDADKTLLAEKTDNKPGEYFVEQWKYAKNYMDRREAIDYFAKKKMPELAEGLNDKYWGIRLFTLTKFDASKSMQSADVLSKIEAMVDKDPYKQVKAKAIEILAKLNDKKYASMFAKNVEDSSYSVAGAALEGLSKLDPANTYALAKKYGKGSRGKLGSVVSNAIIKYGTEEDYSIVSDFYKDAPLTQEKLQQSAEFADYLGKVKNEANVRKGVDMIMDFRNIIPEQFRNFTDPAFKNAFSKLSKAQKENGNSALAEYISGLIK